MGDILRRNIPVQFEVKEQQGLTEKVNVKDSIIKKSINNDRKKSVKFQCDIPEKSTNVTKIPSITKPVPVVDNNRVNHERVLSLPSTMRKCSSATNRHNKVNTSQTKWTFPPSQSVNRDITLIDLDIKISQSKIYEIKNYLPNPCHQLPHRNKENNSIATNLGFFSMFIKYSYVNYICV